MKYLRLTKDGIKYPFYLSTLKTENPNVSFPGEMTDELLAEYGVYPVTPVERPERTLTQDPVEQTPQQIDGVWTQVWAMVDVSQEEAVRRQAEADDAAHAESVKTDTFVSNFITMTPAQVTSYVENNTGNLAQTRALLNKMALMLLVLARREYR